MLSNNMFAYCLNNPVRYLDPSGCWSTMRGIQNPNPTSYGGGEYRGWIIPDKVREAEELRRMAHNLFNSSEEAVMYSDDYAFYNGALVIRHSSTFLTSWAIGGMIFLNSNRTTVNTLKHEYGHILQERELGTPNYLLAVFIPSATYNIASRFSTNLSNNYYNMPWEYDADIRGNAIRNHAPWADTVATVYFASWR